MVSGYREGEKPNTGKRRGAWDGVTVRARKGGQPRLRHCYSGGRRPQAKEAEAEKQQQREVDENERRRKFELEKLKVESETSRGKIQILAHFNHFNL